MKLFSLTLVAFAISTVVANSAPLEKPRVFMPTAKLDVPDCKGKASTKVKNCEKFKCVSDMPMGMKAELIIHGYSVNKKHCMISTPNQRMALDQKNLARLASHYGQMDKLVSHEQTDLLSGRSTYKFKDFACSFSSEDVWDTAGLKVSDANCMNIMILNGDSYCSDGKTQPQVKFSRLSLDPKSDAKCKGIDLNISEDFVNQGVVVNIKVPNLTQ